VFVASWPDGRTGFFFCTVFSPDGGDLVLFYIPDGVLIVRSFQGSRCCGRGCSCVMRQCGSVTSPAPKHSASSLASPPAFHLRADHSSDSIRSFTSSSYVALLPQINSTVFSSSRPSCAAMLPEFPWSWARGFRHEELAFVDRCCDVLHAQNSQFDPIPFPRLLDVELFEHSSIRIMWILKIFLHFRPTLAPFRLSDIFGKSWHTKKLFPVRNYGPCDRCGLNGHNFSFCPLRNSEVSDKELVPYVQMLLDLKTFDISVYVGLSTVQARDLLLRAGRSFNEKNPWRKSGRARDGLRKNLGFWYCIGSPRNVLSWLAYGLRLRPFAEPEHLEFDNHPSYRAHLDFVEEQLVKHTSRSRFAKVKRDKVKMCHPLHVDESVKSNGSVKLRICNDMRMLNGSLAHMRFRMETAEKAVPSVVSPSDWLASADMETAYYSVWMHKSAWPYQCFKHNGEYFQGRVLLFGESQAPWVFTKINKPSLAFFRVLLLRLTNFIDDWLTAADGKGPRETIDFVVWVLRLLGWTLNNGKCVLDPVKVILYLGMLIDSDNYEYRVPGPKLDRARALLRLMLERALAGRHVDSADIRKLTGLTLSFVLAIPAVRVWTRSLYSILPREGDGLVLCAEDQIEELRMLDFCMSQQNGNPIKRRDFSDTIKLDAGETGAGGHVVGGDLQYSGPLHYLLIGTSSTRREMVGFKMFLVERGETLAHKRVRFVFDSAASVCIMLKGGSPVPSLTRLTKDITLLLLKWHITAVYEWTPRENNVEADRLSKRWDQSWALTEAAMTRVRQRFPGVRVSLKRFNTISNFLETRKKVREVLIVPFWPSQRWWPLLMEYSRGLLWLGQADSLFQPSWVWDPVQVGRPVWRVGACLL
jgi:hypothetical protein